MSEAPIIYRCPGSCEGVSVSSCECGDETCDLFEQPLVACTQCEACSAATADDGQPHGCPGCAEAE